MKTTTLNKSTLKNIQTDIIAALAQIEKKYGIQVSNNGGSFTDTSATLKLNIAVKTQTGEVISMEAADFNRYAKEARFGFKLGDTFLDGKTKYTIAGYRPRAREYKFVIKSSTGKKCRVSYDFIMDRI